ncbi:luciferase-like monooxygenase superfamily protein [Mycolicibacterium phlei]|uniref:F420-dependent oxidoreductase n=1 Tax=Mycolicibacterium phlei DSM 43239 = CCUG 21000 TaxID=1226750 RepID=A0A5N5VCJ2_MYCPH|nr:LLM class F420-dependent oxidoreductase [Mycolicibacterium phlei]VEG11587.1 luciferase-like monooxygenase superfamily protein [Mycobacteroides chelonae]AMO63493.1 Pyrimidine monooxygenase RutA [Mycolicibacterium phlei]EID14487.1 monooxygenase [Mycolicibacterium phlei RIVM601174]KAB7759661.1 F420-dependent oxidoreductase [Mycolicibacterium phlei DSM 43239 = CCUG 21000]KXW63068.1 F420-dependent oxidoreductase [Mycolicibacterium phlei DSM 43070]
MSSSVDFRVFVEPQQGATYADQLAVARAAEELGYSAFFRSDHYLAMSGDGGPGPTDSWVTLAGIARETSTIRLGTMVTSATFRYPGPLAISVAQVDEMSGGRVEFGIGAGWFEEEHKAYAIPFPPLRERFDRLTEQLEIITGLWSTPKGETFDYSGTHYSVSDSPGLPKPAQSPYPPIIIGGQGAKRTPALAARYAAEFNVPFVPLETVKTQFARVAAAVAEAGREPDSMTYSAAFVVCAGRDEAEIARRAAAIRREVDELRSNSPTVGTAGEIADRLGPFIEAGVQRVYLQVLDMSDLDHLDFFAREVIPQLR